MISTVQRAVHPSVQCHQYHCPSRALIIYPQESNRSAPALSAYWKSYKCRKLFARNTPALHLSWADELVVKAGEEPPCQYWWEQYSRNKMNIISQVSALKEKACQCNKVCKLGAFAKRPCFTSVSHTLSQSWSNTFFIFISHRMVGVSHEFWSRCTFVAGDGMCLLCAYMYLYLV